MILKCKSSLGEVIGGALAKIAPDSFEVLTEEKNLWGQLLDAVQASSLSDAMKVACVAQAIIESGRGTSRVSKECQNFWGIKMRPELGGIAVGLEVPVTSEVEGKAVFAKFASVEKAVAGWLIFLSRPYYKGWENFKDDSEGFIRHIGKSWCPAPGYADKVVACIPEAKKLLKLSDAKILCGLNSGHAGTSGASGKNKAIQEHVEVFAQRAKLKELLEATGKFTCENVDQTQFKGDLLATGKAFGKYRVGISLHLNAATGEQHGVEVLIGNGTSESRALAAKVSASVAQALGLKDRGVKEKSVSIIAGAREAGCPCFILVESFFVDAETDPAECRRKTMVAANAIAKTVTEFYK